MKLKSILVLKRITTSLCIGLAFAAISLCVSCGGGNASPSPSPSPPTPPVVPPSVSVAISPKAVTVEAGQSQGQTFIATVTGSTNTNVTWTVQEGQGPGGIITTTGIYFPPQTTGIFHVVATSQADPTKSDTATVTVTVGLEVSPSSITLGFGEIQPFTATVIGSANTAVTWTVQEGAAGGSITNTGIYTAPQSQGTFHVIATSQADSRISATVTISVVPIAVTIWPPKDTLGPGGVRAFRATVTASNTAVTWSVEEGAAGGSITNTGVYTAPQSLGTFHVIATSLADPSKSAVAPITVVQSGFTETGSMTEARQGHAAALLTDGRVLITGGGGEVTSDCGCGPIFASAEIFDPASGSFTVTGSMTAPRESHTATLLSNGKVLVAGGNGSAVAELFDPASGTFASAGAMTTLRSFHSATLLLNGKVLIAGGRDNSGPLATAELFDPANGTFTATGSMSTPRAFHAATLLPNGKVLVGGGGDNSGPLATAELFDPASGVFALTGSMATPRELHTATLLSPGGKVLIAGGSDRSGPLATAELYDPAAGNFTATGNMDRPRAGHTAAALLNGSVLIAGGADVNNFGLPGVTAELFDPASGTFTPTGSMIMPRIGHTATPLRDGRVLVTGGFIDDAAATATAELYK